MRRILLVCSFLGLAVGCGNKSDLYLPEEEPVSPPVDAGEASPAATSETGEEEEGG